MRYGIQRRGVYLTPAGPTDLDWIAAALGRPEIWEAFGASGPIGGELLTRRDEVVIGVVRRAATRARVGFVLVFPPGADLELPELAYALPRRADRDAFTALAAADALCHYVFDHLAFEAVAFRTRSSNLAALAVLRRLGYPAGGEVRIRGSRYVVHRVDQRGWRARRARLEAGERRRPSGLGATFVTLRGPPWVPLVPATVSPSGGSR